MLELSRLDEPVATLFLERDADHSTIQTTGKRKDLIALIADAVSKSDELRVLFLQGISIGETKKYDSAAG